MDRQLKLPIYLDHSATTPVDPGILREMLPYLCERFGNSSSRSHIFGWEARTAIEEARRRVSVLIGSSPSEIIWTSGATESNNLAIKSIARARATEGKHIVTVETEHKSVLGVCKSLENEGFSVSYLKVRPDGILNLTLLEETLRRNATLVSVMLVNHEIGVVHNIICISKLCQKYKVPFHVDASQAVGKVAINVTEVTMSALSLSSHKNYGPKGIGALYLNNQNDFLIEPLVHGGGQELNIRSGTLPTHQIVGMGLAYDLIRRSDNAENRRIKRLSTILVSGLSLNEMTKLNGSLKRRIPHSINLNFGCVEGESLILSIKNIGISSGSACTSVSLEPSYVLQALGCGNEAHNSLRFSLGRYTTELEVNYITTTVSKKVHDLRQLSSLWESIKFNDL